MALMLGLLLLLMEELRMPVLGALVVTSNVAPTGICGVPMRPLKAATPPKEVTRG